VLYFGWVAASGLKPRPTSRALIQSSGLGFMVSQVFYETAGVVKVFVFVFAFVFSLVAFFLLPLLLPLFASCIHPGLLSALWVNPLTDSVHGGVR
jgi:hypothetical protein